MEYFPSADAQIGGKVDAYAAALTSSRPVPGLAVGILKGDSLIVARGYGSRHLREGGVIGPQTVFHTASISKTFVATALLQLQERGKVDLDAPVGAYLPYFALQDDRAGSITVRHLLTHTAGLPADVEGGEWWKSPEVSADALERFVRSLSKFRLRSRPGEKWSYSNLGYEVLGDVVAKAAAMSFEDYVDPTFLHRCG